MGVVDHHRDQPDDFAWNSGLKHFWGISSDPQRNRDGVKYKNGKIGELTYEDLDEVEEGVAKFYASNPRFHHH